MKFLLLVEGHTEVKALPSFLKRWLDPQLNTRVGIKAIRFEGWRYYVEEAPKKVRLHLSGPKGDEILSAIGLLDLYGPTFYPSGCVTASDRCAWAKDHLEKEVGNARFSQFFAVHETEAWLLSEPDIFPAQVGNRVQRMAASPEAVNFTDPPAKRLARLYWRETRRTYKKVTHGVQLFSRLDPEKAYAACPKLKTMLDKMLDVAKKAGL